MFWILLGVVIAVVLALLPWGAVIGAGLALGVLMHIASLLEQLLDHLRGQSGDPTAATVPDPETLLRRLARARLAPRGKYRSKRSEAGGR
ncbi:hypothetical protein J2Z79_000989 [Symbiobacterium terraclitae]|uniref:Uncharacterized protein n=1 Tax=Symbiobacterium terraclitae TaxID=557451 RepID=A0ABS4JPY9_9FIRM|nr:hypothetical protein [Symbiobacterium terraclitae]MBP2017604.1 hypothetical protein [Symbiobacterium terraclitae]